MWLITKLVLLLKIEKMRVKIKTIVKVIEEEKEAGTTRTNKEIKKAETLDLTSISPFFLS